MNNFLALLVFLVITACQSKKEPLQNSASTPSEMASLRAPTPGQDDPSTEQELAPDVPVPAPGQPAASVSRKFIRNAQVRIRVTDFTASGRDIEQMVRQAGGQITTSNETKTGNSLENALTIRVPAARFDALLALIVKESIFTDTKTITAEDVTRRYVDTEARIRSKKTVEETYLRLLKQAKSVADVLKVDEQLAQIREEREVQEAELRQLKDEVALSTLNLTYYQQTEAALRPEEPVYAQIWHNLTEGSRLIGDVAVGLFYFIPLGLLVGGVIWLVQRWRRQRRNAVK